LRGAYDSGLTLLLGKAWPFLFTTLDPFASNEARKAQRGAKNLSYTEERPYEGSRESRPGRAPDAEEQVKSFIDKFDPNDQALVRSMRKALRKRLPTANELVYDNYNFFVIGYCSSERRRLHCLDCRRGERSGSLFYRGATLPDPHKMLLGSGNQNRFIRIESAGRWFGPRLKHSSLLLSRKPSPLCQLAEREGSSFALFLQGRGRAVSQRTSSR
jgi:hypothetical protein